ncbi:cytokine receptor [Helicoverpa zea]|uniref:cytokine receptor n=1 Tax=Helicoverpa zea TaxID=7113 RepID=UPI001F578CF1|nr:cytokine receptor [Helicoverpa zea]
MANICTNTRRKCKGFRRGPQFGLWMWCIVIKCLISLPCIFSMCQGVDISVSVYPPNMIKLLYGKPLEIFCVADDNYTADNLEFYIGGKHIDTEIVNSTTRRLYLENLEKKVYTYYCRNTVTNKQCTSRVLVDVPPSNVTDFGCVSKNLDGLNCTWTSPENYSVINYNLTFSIHGNEVDPCIATRIGKLRYCSWNTVSQPRYKQMEEYYYFHLKSCNYFGCIHQNFTIDHFSVVKPYPPEQLKVLGNDTHSVLLQWKIPNNIYDFLKCAIVHRIEYQIAKIDNMQYFRSVNASSLPPKNKTYTFLLSNLPYAHMSYEVRIYIKSESATEDKFWSDFAYVMFTTASERPRRPPDTIAGAFDQSIYENKRVIYVYWKQLEEYEEAGANFTYRVVTKGSRNPQTIFPDKNKSLSYVILDDATLEAIDVSISSVNAMGSSVNSSHLYIPSRADTESLNVPSFTKLAYENGTYKLSWVGIRKIDNYTLFWCQHNTSQICTGRMNFTVLDPNQNTHVIDLPRDSRYQFAISANNGSKTSGMTWASCDISKDGIPMYGFPVKVNHDAPGKSFVKITWTMSCTLQEGIIKGYLISYCPVLATSNVCDTTFGNKSTYYVSDPKQKEVNITGLKPYTTYQFILALNTTYGLKTIENASTGVTTIEDTPTSPRNVSISEVQSDSLLISWYPPNQKNGIIGKYVILNYGEEWRVEKVADKDKNISRLHVQLTGLQGFTNYSFSVQACNSAIRSCSKPSPEKGIFVRTRIGPPSILKAPSVKSNPDYLTWEPPEFPGGTVDLYQIKRVKDESTAAKTEILNTTNLSYSLILCEGVDESETYQVRAINFDEDPFYGILTDGLEVAMPSVKNKGQLEYPGPWSPASSVSCKSRDGLTMILILTTICALIGVMYGSIKLYKKYRKMEDIKPVLPNGLGIPEKDISKYAFGGWNPTNKDDKPSSDEMLLLPNSRTTVSTPETKQNTENNCGSSDHTDSTALSDTSRGAVERQASTSDDGSDSSLNLEVEPVRADDINATQDEESSNSSDTDNSRENTPYFSDKVFKKNPSGYVQPVVNPISGYVQSAPAPHASPIAKPTAQPTSSSYVMAALAPPIFTTGVAQPSVPSQPPASSGYVMPEDAQAKSMMNFPKLGPSPTKVFGSESLPIMPTLPQPVKHGADSSYIQLQSLDALPSHKQPVRNSVPLKPPASSGYVSPGDAVINKHLNNMLSGGQHEESAILDPTMSPDAYCRFSWSTDPANDNLHSLLADSHTLNLSKN